MRGTRKVSACIYCSCSKERRGTCALSVCIDCLGPIGLLLFQNVCIQFLLCAGPWFLVQGYTVDWDHQAPVAIKCKQGYLENQVAQGRERQGGGIALGGSGKLRPWPNLCSLFCMLTQQVWIHFSFPEILNRRITLWRLWELGSPQRSRAVRAAVNSLSSSIGLFIFSWYKGEGKALILPKPFWLCPHKVYVPEIFSEFWLVLYCAWLCVNSPFFMRAGKEFQSFFLVYLYATYL